MLTALCLVSGGCVVLAGLYARERLMRLAAQGRLDRLAADQRKLAELMAGVPESFDLHDERDPLNAMTPREVA